MTALVVNPELGRHSWPVMSVVDGIEAHLTALLGDAIVEIYEHVGEACVVVTREGLVGAVTKLRDDPALRLNQLIDICGVDYPDRAERFDVVYQLLSMAKNLRLRVKVTTDARTPVPSLTGLFPVAGWYERETWDCYGVLFEGNPDLRRILTDYGFEGHPFRKDFPLTGYVELRYSEEHKRVVYEPVKLAQDFRSFDFLSPWEGTDYVLPGDEKAEKIGG
ncbi:NADH-quinone oxidoreductase subunit C [Polymorphobacter glacialis]|uniref:NADH-quinone oxidoreductase subunit C n=1 Tax=Sandarakinorhabdus glacialis TaxID=1614636 RepID=A0A917E5G6_9SPHN|nr:NADH-quinone oxidoreductase subunit C [Polymorphobacter glacialis]GGE06231.1 NADH-quinone oxidoreductase subunit C [Polymorphobacter glacialis]